MKPADLVWLARNLTGDAPEVKAARTAIAEHLLAKYLADNASARSIPCPQWQDFAACLAKDITPEQKTQWAAKLRQAYVEDAEGLALLKTKADLNGAVGALTQLGDGQATGVILSFMQGSAAWRAWSATDQARLAQDLAKLGDAGKAGRQLLAEQVATRHLADVAATKAVGTRDWKDLTASLAKDMTDEAKAQWTTRLREAFAGGQLGRAEFQDMVTASAALGDAAAASTWTAASTSWQSWDSQAIADLAGDLARLGDKGRAQRQALAAHVAGKYLVDSAAAKAVPTSQWDRLTGSLAGELAAEAKADWIAKLRAAFLTDTAALKDKGAVDALVKSLGYLGDPQASAAAAAFVAGSTAWQSWKPDELAWLTEKLAASGDAGKPARQTVIGHLGTRYLADVAAAKSVGTNIWRQFSEALAKDLAVEVRAEWAAKLRAAFLEDVTVLKDKGAVDGLLSALAGLGDTQANGVAASFVAGSTVWQSWKPEDVAWLAGRLQAAGDAGRPGRQAIIQHLATKSLADATAVKAVGTGNWKSFCQALSKDLSAEEKSLWVTKLVEGFAASPEALSALKQGQMGDLADSLTVLGSGERCPNLAITLVEQCASWKTWDAGGLAWLSGVLVKAADAGKNARIRLFEHITAKYLDDATALKTVSHEMWRALAGNLAKDLPIETQQLWGIKLRMAFAGSAEALGALKLDQLRSLVDTMRALGDDQASELAATLVNSTLAWQSWPAAEYAALSAAMPKTSPGAAEARRRIIQHITEKLISSAAAVRQVSCPQWAGLTGEFGRHMDGKTRQAWLARLREAFAPNPETVASLKLEGLKGLVGAMSNLGNADGADIVAAYARQGTAWQAWAPDDLVWLSSQLAEASIMGRSARQKLAEHLTAGYLASVEAVKKLKLTQWRMLATNLRDVLPPEAAAAWVEKIRQAYAADQQALYAMKAADLRDLVSVVGAVKLPDSGVLALAYLDNRDGWAGVPAGVLADLANAAATRGVGKDKVAPLMADLEKHWLSRYAAKPLTFDECQSVKTAWLHAGSQDKAREWAIRGYEVALGSDAARKAANQGTLISVSASLLWIGLTGKGKAYPNYTATFTQLAVGGKLNTDKWWYPASFSEPLGTPEAIQAARDVLLDSEGNPRPAVAKTLAWAYKKCGDFKAWEALVNQGLSGAPDGTDKKALWLLAKAYTEAIVPPHPNAHRCKRFIDVALATAQSPEARLAALTDLATYYRWVERSGVAVNVLESVKHQFAGDALARITAVQDRLRREAAEMSVVAARERVAQERRQKLVVLKEVRQRLTLAQKDGNQDEVARLRGMVQQLEQGVGE